MAKSGTDPDATALILDLVCTGAIGIDTLENVEYPMTREALDEMLIPLKKNFQSGSRQFVDQMFLPKTDAELRKWILADIASAPPAVALSAMEHLMSQYITGEAAKIFEEIRIPVVTINGDMWPVNHEANRRHMFSFEAIVFKEADHFLMMNRVEKFNHALERAIKMTIKESSLSAGPGHPPSNA